MKKGFLLFDVLLYALMAVGGVTLFIGALRSYSKWQHRYRSSLQESFYHRHALLILLKDMATSHAVEQPTPQEVIVRSRKLTIRWEEVEVVVRYHRRPEGLFRRRETKNAAGSAIKSTLWMAPEPELLTVQASSRGYIVSYKAGPLTASGTLTPIPHAL